MQRFSANPDAGALFSLSRRRLVQMSAASAGALSFLSPSASRLGAQTPVPNPFGEPQTTGGTAIIGMGGTGTPRDFVGTSYYGTNAFFISKLIYTPLLLLDAAWSNLGPGLARSWEWANDGTQVTLSLRDDVVFQDGTPLTANDVVFTYTLGVRSDQFFAVRDVGIFAGGDDYKAGTTEEFPGVVAIDDHTVQMTLTSPSNVFELNLSNCGIMPAHMFADDTLASGTPIEELPFFSGEGQLPIGTGPWKPSEYSPETHLTLVRHEQYFGGAPVLDGLTLRRGITGPAGISSLQAGEVDSAYINFEDAHTLEGAEHLEIVTNDSLANESVLIFSTEKDYLPVPFRQALLSAVNTDRMIETLTFSYAKPAPSVMMHESLFPNDELATYPFDQERARELLTESGWDMYRELILGAFTSEGTPSNVIAAIMSMWTEIGLKVIFQPLDPANQRDLSLTDDHTYDVTVTNFAWLAYDPSSAYNSFSMEAGNTWSNYANPDFDEVMSEAIRTPTLEDAVPLYQQAQVILQRDLPYAPLWIEPEIWAVNKRLHGGILGRGPLNNIQSEKWWKE